MSGIMQEPTDVLMVEDNPGDAKLLRHHLRGSSFTSAAGGPDITHVDRLDDAFAELSEHPFDVVFLDLGLPESSGMDTLDRFLDRYTTVPVVVLTGLKDHDLSVEAIQRGAQDYLVKDEIDGDTLARSLRYAIERKKSERELRRQKEQMEFFNSILRHDMLNGLEVIKMRAELLERRGEGSVESDAETIVEWSDNIIDLTRKVKSVLDTLTDDSDPELARVDLVPVVQDETERVRGMDDDVTIDVDLPDSAPVIADDLLSEVVGNLLSNAVEHGGDGPTEIEATVTDTNGQIRLDIRDDGPGIDDETKKRVFDRGETGDQSGGSGFGLYFVNSMVSVYGGEVTLADSEDGGTVVTVELPAA
ncbi:ATP-binding protein [Halorientalis pallida]|uniref:hybrid sensor histidine kinase/response regulator n=1 Tax=Halorientalis pallida TaxID=2479928 RepID=UPI003C705949